MAAGAATAHDGGGAGAATTYVGRGAATVYDGCGAGAVTADDGGDAVAVPALHSPYDLRVDGIQQGVRIQELRSRSHGTEHLININLSSEGRGGG